MGKREFPIDRAGRSRAITHSTKVSVGFLAAAGLWIGLSDPIIARLFPQQCSAIVYWKGWVFIFLAALLLKLGLGAEERRRAAFETRLHQEAIYDPLTNLLNRQAFTSHLEVAVERVRRRGTRLGLAFIDLDGFKSANDTFGHAFGDEVLVAVAQRLRGTLRSADIAGRLGGDEFVVVVEPDEGYSAEILAKRLLDAFRRPLDVDGRSYELTLSVGVAHFPDDGIEASQLLRAADMAMYAAKAGGRNGFMVANQDALLESKAAGPASEDVASPRA